MAVSLAGEKLNHYETAARVARELVQKLEREPLDADVLLNINVPDIPYEQLRGMEITRLGRRSQSEPIVHINSGNCKNAFQIGRPGKPEDAGEGTDFDAVDRNRISISPITLDMTHYDRMATLHEGPVRARPLEASVLLPKQPTVESDIRRPPEGQLVSVEIHVIEHHGRLDQGRTHDDRKGTVGLTDLERDGNLAAWGRDDCARPRAVLQLLSTHGDRDPHHEQRNDS